ncbi:MAG: PaaI family thioesterase [Ichthyobacteriaceae bacterium]|nr:PaaI family thioesterase [Ichthyobacteriaceae bacterium]
MNKLEMLSMLNKVSRNTLMQTLSMEYINLGEDFLTAKMPVNSKVYQPMGILHGGATAALAESVGSAASAVLMKSDSHDIRGIELAINHIKSKKEGYVFATAKLMHKGNTLHLWQVEIKDEDDNLISLAKITNIVREKRK